jgi:hypothetical protein
MVYLQRGVADGSSTTCEQCLAHLASTVDAHMDPSAHSSSRIVNNLVQRQHVVSLMAATLSCYGLQCSCSFVDDDLGLVSPGESGARHGLKQFIWLLYSPRTVLTLPQLNTSIRPHPVARATTQHSLCGSGPWLYSLCLCWGNHTMPISKPDSHASHHASAASLARMRPQVGPLQQP